MYGNGSSQRLSYVRTIVQLNDRDKERSVKEERDAVRREGVVRQVIYENACLFFSSRLLNLSLNEFLDFRMYGYVVLTA